MTRPRVSLAELMGSVAVFALTLWFGMPLARGAVSFGPQATRLVLFSLGVFAFNTQILYWFTLVPLVRWLRRRR